MEDNNTLILVSANKNFFENLKFDIELKKISKIEIKKIDSIKLICISVSQIYNIYDICKTFYEEYLADNKVFSEFLDLVYEKVLHKSKKHIDFLWKLK